jgi:signal transduction histidine kinase
LWRLTILVSILLCYSTYALHGSPAIDLSKLALKDDQHIAIDSGWVFHWEQLLSPSDQPNDDGILLSTPGSWTELNYDTQPLPSYGYGTYRIKIIPPQQKTGLAILVPKMFSSARVWINDEIVFESGKVGTNAETTTHFRQSAIIPLQNLCDTIDIAIQVANFYHRKGGLTHPVVLGTTRSLWHQDRSILMSDMILVGSLTFIGFSFLIMYLVYWNMDKAILYFSIFCLCWSYRTLSDGYAPLPHLIDSFRWVWHVKLEYISLFMSGLMGSLFFNSIFKGHFHLKYAKLNSWIIWTVIGLALVLSGYYLNFLLFPFFTLISINIIYASFMLFRIRKDHVQSPLALMGIFTGIIVFSFHMFTYYVLSETNSILVSTGYIIAFMVNSLLLGKRFSISFQSLKKLQNETSEQKQKIARQADMLNKTNDKLEEKVAHRTHELQKVVMDLEERNVNLEQFNYIISHNMRAPVANITGLLSLYNHQNPSDPFNETALQKLNASCHRLDNVLKDLTTILEAKRQAQKVHEEVIFADLFSKIQNAIQQEIEDSNVEFKLDFKVKSIKSVGALWYSIFINLITNGIKYRNADVPCVIRISTSRDEDHTFVCFEDNGLGIDLIKNKNHVFGLYKRFHNHVEGKGMGLFMVKSQIESLGGDIVLKSEPGKGSTFIIQI